MCNCGNKRNAFISQQFVQANNAKKIEPPQKKVWADVSFEYTGSRGLTVTGSVTGKHYRWTKKGDILTVDYRDSFAMRNVPLLRRI